MGTSEQQKSTVNDDFLTKLVAGTMEHLRKLEIVIAIEFGINVDSSFVQSEQRSQIAQAVLDDYDDCDGFVITRGSLFWCRGRHIVCAGQQSIRVRDSRAQNKPHGTNRLGYIAAALSYCIGHSSKPVVITGAQIPAFRPANEGIANLENAIRVAVGTGADVHGVSVVFGSHLITAIRVKKGAEFDLDAFATLTGGNVEDIVSRLRPTFMNLPFNIHFFRLAQAHESSNVRATNWASLAKLTAELLAGGYRGVVFFLRGTNTLCCTAGALSFLLHDTLNRPVILTGSEIPISVNNADAVHNIENAVRAAAREAYNGPITIPEVCIYWANQLLRGNRTTKRVASDRQHSFHTPTLFRTSASLPQLDRYDFAEEYLWIDDARLKVLDQELNSTIYFGSPSTNATDGGPDPYAPNELAGFRKQLKEDEHKNGCFGKNLDVIRQFRKGFRNKDFQSAPRLPGWHRAGV